MIILGCDYLHDIAFAYEKNAQLRCDLEAEAEEVEEVEEVEEPEYEEEEWRGKIATFIPLYIFF